VIVGINGAKVNTAPELQEQIGRKRPGDIVDVEIIKNRSGNTSIVKTSPSEEALMDKLGVDLESLSSSEARKFDLEGGVRINQIREGVVKSNTNIKEGFIITKASDQNIKSVRDLSNALQNKRSRGVMLEGVYPGEVYYYAFGM